MKRLVEILLNLAVRVIETLLFCLEKLDALVEASLPFFSIVLAFLVLEYTYRRDYEVPDITGFIHFRSLPSDSISFKIAQFLGGGEIRWFTYYLFLFAAVLLHYLIVRLREILESLNKVPK